MSAAPRRRVGLLGGSFDPVHNAHLALARVALDHLGLDALWWVPAGDPWQKTRHITPAAHRKAMVELAIAGEPRWRVEPCELERRGPSYTLDTVLELQARDVLATDWVLVIGQDQYARFDTWHGWRELMERVTLAVAGRAGDPPEPGPALAALPHRMEALPLAPTSISSTEIRSRVARGEPVDTLVPPAVARYIAQHRLYLADA